MVLDRGIVLMVKNTASDFAENERHSPWHFHKTWEFGRGFSTSINSIIWNKWKGFSTSKLWFLTSMFVWMEYIPHKMPPRDMFEKTFLRDLKGAEGWCSRILFYIHYIDTWKTSPHQVDVQKMREFLHNHGSIQDDHIDTHCKRPEIRFLECWDSMHYTCLWEDF